MKGLFFNAENRLRNGWWILVFLTVLIACLAGFQFLLPALKRHGIRIGIWLPGVLFLLSVLATGVCLTFRKESAASVGWQLDRRWAREFAVGTLLGVGLMVLAAGLLWSIGAVTWELDPGRSFRAVSIGLLTFTLVAFWEENLFRGFVFQRLLDGIGVWPTQAILALLFALSHWSNPGMHGVTKFWASLGIALAAVLLGLAYLRTRSLALPIGIHLGWNWFQGHILGFSVSGNTQPGWIQPLFHGKAEWVSGGAFGPEASVFGVATLVLGIFLLWKWKGRSVIPFTQEVKSSVGGCSVATPLHSAGRGGRGR